MALLPRIGLCLLVFLAGCSTHIEPGAAPSPSPGPSPNPGGSSSATYAYVSNARASGAFQISGYSVGSDGTLKEVSGSPFPTTGYRALSLAAGGSLLFGADGYSVYSFSVGSGGPLEQIGSFTAGALSTSSPASPVAGPVDLFLDTSATTLYDGFANLNGTENNGYQALTVNASTGQVALIGDQGSSPELDTPLVFSNNDQFAYTSSCYHGIPAISRFQRGANGALTELSTMGYSALPTPPSGESYCPSGAAADSSGHLIVAVGSGPGNGMEPTGPWQLAVYTIDGAGNLSTTSTSANMPTVKVGQPNTYILSPDNKYLAVGGQSGLQVFQYTATTGTITALGSGSPISTDNVNRLAWDSGDRLYAVSIQGNSFAVYSVSSSGATPVAGSARSIQNPEDLTIVTQANSSS